MTSHDGRQVHLTEEERQEMADGSLPAERARELQPHLRGCAACSADVARLERLVSHAREAATAPSAAVGELWPGIRTRIEGGKLAPFARGARLGTQSSGASMVGSRIVLGVAAATVVAALLLIVTWGREVRQGSGSATGSSAIPTAVAVDDSARAYQEEAQVLLDQLELRRAMLRPEAAAAIDHDLAVVDAAIAEVRAAISRDPNNPALRQLLALSYRKKLEVLQRVSNAG